MSWRTSTTCCSFQGIRNENEDFVRVDVIGSWTFAMVLDGIGGRGQGVRASRIAGATIAKSLREHLSPSHEPSIEAVSDGVFVGMAETNRALWSMADPHRGRGASSVAVVGVPTQGRMALAAHFGQPFVLHVRDAVVKSVFPRPKFPVEPFVDPIHPLLGDWRGPVEIPTAPVEIAAGDFLIVGSGGIAELSAESIVATLRAEKSTAAGRLCERALAGGFRGYVTAAVIKIVHES